MSEPSHEQSDALANRAGEMGEQVGRFAVLAIQRIERMVREGTPNQPSGEPTGMASEPTGTSEPSATRRAEEMLDSMGERLGQLVSLAGPSVRKLTALAREEAEDIWAEAQHVRAARERSQSDSGAETQSAETPPRAV